MFLFLIINHKINTDRIALKMHAYYASVCFTGCKFAAFVVTLVKARH